MPLLMDGRASQRLSVPSVLTIFTNAKPFRGRTAVIQRNALHSWMLLHPSVQIILFGDAPGAQEVAWELGLHYEQHPELTASGSVRLDYMFTTAQRAARFRTLCYVPCDTVLLPDFYTALTRVEALYLEFLMVGRSRELNHFAPLPLDKPDWQELFRERAQREARETFPERVAYVAFSKGICLADLPPVAIDSPFCANWLLWKTLSDQVAVVDASEMVVAVQQCGDSRSARMWQRGSGAAASSAAEFLALCGSHSHLKTVAHAPYLLSSSDVVPNRWRKWHFWRMRAARFAAQALRGW